MLLALRTPLLLLVVVWVGSALALEPRMLKGTVISASNGSLVVKDKAGKEQSFLIEAATKVTVNGKPGRLEDLQETMPVQVTSDERGKVLAVSTMDADKHLADKPRGGIRSKLGPAQSSTAVVLSSS